MIPSDPVMLLSFINMKLRDFYSNLDDLCKDLDIDKNKLIEDIGKIDYVYNEDTNQFV